MLRIYGGQSSLLLVPKVSTVSSGVLGRGSSPTSGTVVVVGVNAKTLLAPLPAEVLCLSGAILFVHELTVRKTHTAGHWISLFEN